MPIAFHIMLFNLFLHRYLLFRLPGDELWAIEIKHGLAPKIGRGFNIACEDLGATRKFVVYDGADQFPVGEDTMVLSLQGLLARLTGG